MIQTFGKEPDSGSAESLAIQLISGHQARP
jgi:hypothetical protein